MTDGILKATSSLRIGETQTAHRCDDMKKDRTRSTAKILFVVGDAVDCHDAMVPFQMFSLMGHVVHAVSPGKRAGETVMTRISSPVSDWNRREKNERPFALTASFADIDPCDYDGLVIACGQPVGDAGFDRIVLSTVRSFAADGRPIATAFHGALLLAAAGVIRGRQIGGSAECAAEIRRAGGEFIDAPIGEAVCDRNLITGRALSPDLSWLALFSKQLGVLEVETDVGKGAASTDQARENRRRSVSARERGIEVIGKVGSENFDRLSSALNQLSPDFKRLLIEGYGDILGRAGLDLKSRELVTVAVLAALGNVAPALKYHAAGMLNTGWTPGELVETVLHSSLYAGFPAAVSGLQTVREVFRERDILFKPEMACPLGDDAGSNDAHIGWLMNEESGQWGASAIDSLDARVKTFAYGRIWNRPGLSLKDRQLATLAMLIAQGNRTEAVRLHLEACLRLGWTRVELTEVLIQLTGYIGWPLTLTITRLALEVFEKFERQSPAGTTDGAERADAPTGVDEGARHELGLQMLRSCYGAKGEAMVDEIADIAPDLGRYIIEFVCADVAANTGLDAKSRELGSVAALAALGRASDTTALEMHVHGALNVGAKRQEVMGAILNTVPLAGLMPTSWAADIALTVFASRENVPFLIDGTGSG